MSPIPLDQYTITNLYAAQNPPPFWLLTEFINDRFPMSPFWEHIRRNQTSKPLPFGVQHRTPGFWEQ